MIRSVVRTYHWSPKTIDDLYLNDRDHFGLIYWYNDSKDLENSLTINTEESE